MKFFLSFLVALSLVSVAESWAPSDRSLAGRRATAPKTNTQLRDLIDGNVQWYSTTSANSPAVTKDAVNRNLKAAAKQFMRYQSGYFSPMTPNENLVNNNRNMNGMGDNTNNMNGNYNYNYNTYSGGVTYSGGYYSNNYNQNTPNNYQNNNINNNRNANYQNNNNNFNRNANYQNNSNNFNGNNNYQNNNNRNNNNNFNRNNYSENKNNQNRNFNNFKYNDPRYNILADDFVFGSPVIGPLNKWDYIDGIDYFKVYEAFPDINPNCYGFSIDLVNPLKVRFFVKATGTYQNKLGGALGKLGAKPDGRQYMGSTEAWSITFNERMQVRAISAGYVVDRFENKSVCTTDGKGLTLGVLHTTGVKSLPTDPGSSFKWLSGLFANGGSDGLFPKTFSNSKELPQWWTESRKAPN